MVQAARRRDDGDYVTKGDLRQALAEMENRLLDAITYTNRLNEMILDEIKPNWRESPPST